jgi:hypothetical protein
MLLEDHACAWCCTACVTHLLLQLSILLRPLTICCNYCYHKCRLEENGDYDNALESAHKAMSIYKKDVWALHAEAHVYEMQGRANEGQSRLRATVISANHYIAASNLTVQ